jgi:hypothetical protein
MAPVEGSATKGSWAKALVLEVMEVMSLLPIVRGVAEVPGIPLGGVDGGGS